jgi:dynein heavy chain
MYLESIFMASEDIRKQLPTEAIIFEDMNNKFKNVMSAVHKDPNAERSCTEKGRLEIVVDMDNKLQEIQKSRDAYLETKRMAFPRFYLLSNDDLLEILGQAKEPAQVQKHI